MNYNSQHSKPFQNSSLGAPGSGFGARGSRFNSKRLSVALPPEVAPISEDSALPTPRTSRSYLLAGLRTQPKTPAVPASAPYHQQQHEVNGLAASRWADPGFGYDQSTPQTATGASFDMNNQYAMRAGQQMYSLPEQVLAPPSLYEQQAEGMDPSLLQQLQMTSLFLAQRQQQLQQKLAALSYQDMPANGIYGPPGMGQMPQTPQTPQNLFPQQQQHQHVQSPIEVQPGVYLVYNPAIQGYSYAYDQSAQLNQNDLVQAFQAQSMNHAFDTVTTSGDRARSFTPPTKSNSPSASVEKVEPLPPPSANAFRRGHQKASSLAINPGLTAAEGPKTSSAASFGSQRTTLPQPPLTGTFGPGSARAGEHPIRQPRGPPPLEELSAAPTSKHEGSKNFATRQRRRALDNLMRAGTQRRGASRSSGGSPISEREYNFTIPEDTVGEELASSTSSLVGSRKMSPIGHEMKQKRGSQSSNDGYFGLSSASSSECDDATFKPPTPATPIGLPNSLGGDDRRKMMMGVLNAAEKRKSTFI